MKLNKITLLLVILSLVFALAACSSNNNTNETPGNEATTPNNTNSPDEVTEVIDDTLKPEEGAKLVIWDAPESKEYLEAMAKEFEAEYGISVEYQEVGGPDALNRIIKDGPAGVGADVMLLPHDNLDRAVTAGVIMPNDYYAEETKANFAEAAVNAVTTQDGILYGYPRNMETYLLYYNKELVKAEDLATWDSIKAFSKAYNNTAEKKFGIMWKLDDTYFNYAFIAGNGGYVFGKNGTDPTDVGLNNEGAIEGMKLFQSMKEVMPFKVADATTDVKTDLFQKGKLAINLDGIWQLGTFTTEKLGFEVGAVVLPPMPNGNSPKPFAGVKAYFVSSFTEYPNAAKVFIQYLTSQEALEKNYEMAGIIPARNGMDQSDAMKDDELAKVFMEQFKNVEAMPSIQETGSMWTAMGGVYAQLWEGADVKTTLDKAVSDMKTLIEQAK